MAKAANSTITDLERALAKGELKPVYLLIGEEPFLRHRARNLIHERIVGTEKGSVSIFTSDDPLETILADLRGDSLFASRRMVEVIQADKLLREKCEAMIRYVERPSASGVLVLDAAKVDGRTKLPGALRAAGMIVECPPIRESELPGWVRSEVSRRGCKITGPAASALIDEVGNNLFALSAELDKLVTYAGDKKEIGAEEVSRLGGGSRNWATWAITDALGKRDAAQALRILPTLLEEDPRGVGTVGKFNWHFARLARAKQILTDGGTPGDLPGALGIPPFAAQTTAEQVRNLTTDGIARLSRLLLEVDIALKSTGQDPRMLLEKFVIRACRPSASALSGRGMG